MCKSIVIIVEGGLVQEITGIPPGYQVIVKDYDIEGSDNAGALDADEEGRLYLESVHENRSPAYRKDL